MKQIILSLVVIVSASVLAEEAYKFKSKINVDDILKNDRLLNAYFNCLAEKGPCTAPAAEVKKILPNALSTHCQRCTKDQRNDLIKTVKFLSEQKPEMWKVLSAKYDPEGAFKEAAKSNPDLKEYNLKL